QTDPDPVEPWTQTDPDPVEPAERGSGSPCPGGSQHSGQTNLADALRETLEEQHSLIQSHEAVLRSLSKQQNVTNQRLEYLGSLLQKQQSEEASQAGDGPPPQPTPQPSQSSDYRAPTPDKFSGEAGGSGGFLLQCSLVFHRSTHSFPNDDAKISFVLGLLTGKALRWAEARFTDPTKFDCSFLEFVEEFKLVFGDTTDQTSISRRLWSLKQGQRTVAEFSIELRTLAAASDWNGCALKSAFFHALNESIKDELAPLDEPKTLNELITLATRLDNRIRERRSQRHERLPVRFPGLTMQRAPQPAQPGNLTPDSEPEPMQIGRTRLTPEERQRRRELNQCMYCGKPGHYIVSCPVRPNTKVRQSEWGN
uniref:CCHC-type domain-containing protein n=1 Tax=Poecilia latipinna TaxID=48699 RepID=A0A3B3TX12_9TELE